MRSSLPRARRKHRHIIEAGLALAAIVPATRLLRLRTVRRVIHRLWPARGGSRSGARAHDAQELVAAVKRAGAACRLSRGCLHQALAAELMLRRRGIEADLCFGVSRKAGGVLEAHAWVEVQGQPVGELLDPATRYSVLR